MERRKFLASSLAASALAVTAPGSALEAAQGNMTAKGREFYQLRRYHINAGPQRKLCDDFFRDALIPALNRLSISPVGVFDLSIGPDTPSIYVLMPGRIGGNAGHGRESPRNRTTSTTKAGAAFLTAPAKEPAFDRMDSTFLQAFEKWPNLVLAQSDRHARDRAFSSCASMKARPTRITAEKWK